MLLIIPPVALALVIVLGLGAEATTMVAAVVLISAAASFAVSKLAVFAALSEGMRTIVLTVALAAAAALLFPVKDEEAKEEAP